MRLGWRAPLVYAHRWLGIGGCGLFVAWFASGIVMMYARMPRLSLEERLFRDPDLELSALRVSPQAAAARLGLAPDELRIGMLGERPVYRFLERGLAHTAFADDGERLAGLTLEQALVLARRFAPEHAATLRYGSRLADVDQWTIGVRRLLPLHRIDLGDADDTHVYFSDRTGEAVMKTTRAGRLWGYLGAVTHWIYPTALRRHGALWAQTVIWLSIAGCLLSLSGLVWGVWRYSAAARFRFPDGRSRSPYAGLMRWHHYAGLVFGCFTFTWIFSGLLSMEPGDWSPSTTPLPEQRARAAGAPYARALTAATPEQIRSGAALIRARFPAKELELVQFRGEAYLSGARTLLVALAPDARGAFERFDAGEIEKAARAAMPDAAAPEMAWIDDYDAYYYDRTRAKPLPVLRTRYSDARGTWLYLDPRSGTIVHKEERLSRVNRWLYHGLHSLDFPFLLARRPLWDVVVIVLSLGGMLLSATTLLPAWRRLRRHARRLRSH